jgi:hypothetical protein
MKQTPRTSPEPIPEEEQRYLSDNIASRLQSPEVDFQATAGAHEENDMEVSHHDSGEPVEGC